MRPRAVAPVILSRGMEEVAVNMLKFISREKARADCYRFLAACFYRPRKDVFLPVGLFGNLAASLDQVSPDVVEIARELERAFAKYDEEAITVEYARLFVGPHELIAPPYGSVYLDRERRVMGDSTMEAAVQYREAGLDLAEDYREVPDHITAELEFMYYLLFRECEALERADRDAALRFLSLQETFFNKHLARWAPQFCDRIRQGTDNEFYARLADCLSAFIANEHIGTVAAGEFPLKEAARG